MVPPAVFLDAMGTLVQLERPWPHLVAALASRGVAIDEQQAREAMLAEIGYYREHHDEAGTEAGLDDLRRRCAEVVAHTLGADVIGALPAVEIEAAMLEALRFRAYPEVPGVLAGLRADGYRLVVVSNWDISLNYVLEQTGLASLVDAVVVSAQEGCAKPNPRIFTRALELAGTDADHATHVGDSVEADVVGAQRAGIRAVFVDREGAGTRQVDGASVIADLGGLASVLG